MSDKECILNLLKNPEELEKAIKEGTDPNLTEDEWGWSLLNIAAGNNYLESVRILLSRGAEVNHQTNTGRTPIFNAAIKGNTEICKLLIDAGADVNAEEKLTGTSPLSQAVLNGHKDTVELLLTNNADHTVTIEGKSMLDLAMKHNYSDIIAMLQAQEEIKSSYRVVENKVIDTIDDRLVEIEDINEFIFDERDSLMAGDKSDEDSTMVIWELLTEYNLYRAMIIFNDFNKAKSVLMYYLESNRPISRAVAGLSRTFDGATMVIGGDLRHCYGDWLDMIDNLNKNRIDFGIKEAYFFEIGPRQAVGDRGLSTQPTGDDTNIADQAITADSQQTTLIETGEEEKIKDNKKLDEEFLETAADHNIKLAKQRRAEKQSESPSIDIDNFLGISNTFIYWPRAVIVLLALIGGELIPNILYGLLSEGRFVLHIYESVTFPLLFFVGIVYSFRYLQHKSVIQKVFFASFGYAILSTILLFLVLQYKNISMSFPLEHFGTRVFFAFILLGLLAVFIKKMRFRWLAAALAAFVARFTTQIVFHLIISLRLAYFGNLVNADVITARLMRAVLFSLVFSSILLLSKPKRTHL